MKDPQQLETGHMQKAFILPRSDIIQPQMGFQQLHLETAQLLLEIGQQQWAHILKQSVNTQRLLAGSPSPVAYLQPPSVTVQEKNIPQVNQIRIIKMNQFKQDTVNKRNEKIQLLLAELNSTLDLYYETVIESELVAKE
mgnify:CR=1 FL=1